MPRPHDLRHPIFGVRPEVRRAKAGATQGEVPRIPAESTQLRLAREADISEGECMARWAAFPRSSPEAPHRATRLKADWDALLRVLPKLGTVRAQTANVHALLEVEGRYAACERLGPMAQCRGERIDLRLLFPAWHAAYALEQATPQGLQRSVHIFDAEGAAVHALHLGAEASPATFTALRRDLRCPEATDPSFASPTRPPSASRMPCVPVLRPQLLKAWGQLRDSHDFFAMLRRLQLRRYEALRLAEGLYTRRIPPQQVEVVMHHAQQRDLVLSFDVRSRGAIALYSSQIDTLSRCGEGLQLRHSRFRLRLSDQAVASAWVVRRQTRGGLTYSLELYDAQHVLILACALPQAARRSSRHSWQALLARI